MGYVVLCVQVDGVPDYDKDQIGLLILDLSDFAVQFPIILGTLKISHIINVIKEETDALVMPWVNARVVHILSYKGL